MRAATAWAVRQATLADEDRIRRLLENARRVMLRFRVADLGSYLRGEPFFLAEDAGRLQGFLAFVMQLPHQGSLFGAGLADGVDAALWLDSLLPPSIAYLQGKGVKALSYTGSAVWLLAALQDRGFHLLSHIASFEKTGWSIPGEGNQRVEVRPVEPRDFDALVAVDAPSFHPRWRNSRASLRQWRASMPYFVVAEMEERVVGYCYCSTGEPGCGHLIRMAVHPDWWSQGIGTRLMAEAIRFFQESGARHITLNAQEENEQAHRLYKHFGFRQVGREATALWREL
jgi:ribosomal-protein-alanine N-acetyltransferase